MADLRDTTAWVIWQTVIDIDLTSITSSHQKLSLPWQQRNIIYEDSVTPSADTTAHPV